VQRPLALCLLGFAVLSPGCSLVCTATHNLVTETRRCTNDYWEGVQERRLARDYWARLAGASPGRVFSQDYADGFEAGFVDFLHNGGAGLPPPLPPERYRQVRYETPEGHVAITQWFDGFRDGAAAAWSSGYRQFVTVPVALAEPHVVPPQPHVLHPTPSPANEFLPPGQQLHPVLPPPRPVEPKLAALQDARTNDKETAGHGEVLRTQYTVPSTQYSVLSTQYPVLSTQYSVPSTARGPEPMVAPDRTAPEPSPLALIRSVRPRTDPVVVLLSPVPTDEDEDGDEDTDEPSATADDTPAEVPLAGK
jgi:hypothetical protein